MNEPYDPQEPEGARSRGSQYVTRKDFKIFVLAIVVVAPAAWMVYLYGLGQVNSSLCNKNVRKIGEALLNYARDNDDHLPFAYERAGYETTDIAVHDGYAYTWQWAIEPYSTGGWSIFKCPAAKDAEHTKTADSRTGTIEISDYGMLNAYSGVNYSTIPNPDGKVIIGETSNHGAETTYDPMPLKANGIELANDGFLIGFNDTQDYPREDGKDPKTGQYIPGTGTLSATRLAFPNTAKGNFSHDSESRHPDGIHYLSAGGGLRSGDGETALVVQFGGGFGLWDVPKPTTRLSSAYQGP